MSNGTNNDTDEQKLNFLQAQEFLTENFGGEELDNALNYLDYMHEGALECIANNVGDFAPVWSKAELLGFVD
jgi:hypothetical protein